MSESAIHINLEFWDIHKLRIFSADVAAAAAGLHKIMQLQERK